jgi:hypothetical protein
MGQRTALIGPIVEEFGTVKIGGGGVANKPHNLFGVTLLNGFNCLPTNPKRKLKQAV